MNREGLDNKGIFFLIVPEIEALMLCDIETIKHCYKIEASYDKNPAFETNAKATLEKLTSKAKRGKYEENHAIEIFSLIDFYKIYQKHNGNRSFKQFADELKKKEIIDF